jgi:hypothetical protein
VLRHVIAASAIPAFAAALSAVVAAPQTPTPGQMTEAHVRIDNRGRGEAVPVDLRDVNLDRPLRVQVVNGDQGGRDPAVAQPTRAARQVWEYDTVTVADGANAAAAMKDRGASGWEAVGVIGATAGRTTILLKRPQ